MQALEAILFLAREPLNTRKISQYANLADGTEALTLIRQLNQLYDQEGRAFRVEQVAGGYQLMTHPALADWLRRLAGTPPEVRLSTPAMETLTVVAYRQPVQRAEIEVIRGVACGEMLRQLMDRDLVRIVGRSEELGRPFLYGTTNRFLHVFGLGGIDELPRAEALRMPVGEHPSNTTGNGDTNTSGAVSESTNHQTKENDKVTATLGDIHDGSLASELLEETDRMPGAAPTVVADIDDDDFDDDDDYDDFEDEDDDDFDDDFDDDYDEDEWDDDDLDDEEADEDVDDEDDADEWEEVEDDEDDLDEDDDEEDDWDDDDE